MTIAAITKEETVQYLKDLLLDHLGEIVSSPSLRLETALKEHFPEVLEGEYDSGFDDLAWEVMHV